MAFCMEWVLIPLQNNLTAVQLMLLKKSKALKALFLLLLHGFWKLFHLAVRKGELNILLLVDTFMLGYKPKVIRPVLVEIFYDWSNELM